MDRRPWQVWFYAPSGERRLIDRFNTRSEAEHHRAKLGRLLGNPALLVVCFEPPDDGETADVSTVSPHLNFVDMRFSQRLSGNEFPCVGRSICPITSLYPRKRSMQMLRPHKSGESLPKKSP